jgi:hypothetical protein
VEASNLRSSGYEPPALIFGGLAVAPKYELHQPVPKAPAQQQPVENVQGAGTFPNRERLPGAGRVRPRGQGVGSARPSRAEEAAPPRSPLPAEGLSSAGSIG